MKRATEIKNFRSEHYYQAANQRMRQALYLYEEKKGSYALAIYVAGVAVEAMLRAFKLLRNPTFDERHDLLLLFWSSGMLVVDREKMRAAGMSDAQISDHRHALSTAVAAVYRLWGNNYRFASEELLRAHLKRITRYQKSKGDYLKWQTRDFLNSAQTFISKGAVLWPLLKR